MTTTITEIKNVEINVERTELFSRLAKAQVALSDIAYNSFSRTKRDECHKLSNHLVWVVNHQDERDTPDLRVLTELVEDKLKVETRWDKYNSIGLGLVFVAFIGNAAGGFIRIITWLIN